MPRCLRQLQRRKRAVKVAKDIFDRLDRGRPPIEKAQGISPAQKLLNFLQHWSKPTICMREVLIYGPRSLRNPASARDSAETLVRYGWLVPAKRHRRDMHKWEIVRKPVIPPVIDTTLATVAVVQPAATHHRQMTR
jgi:hypothetical protein